MIVRNQWISVVVQISRGHGDGYVSLVTAQAKLAVWTAVGILALTMLAVAQIATESIAATTTPRTPVWATHRESS